MKPRFLESSIFDQSNQSVIKIRLMPFPSWLALLDLLVVLLKWYQVEVGQSRTQHHLCGKDIHKVSLLGTGRAQKLSRCNPSTSCYPCSWKSNWIVIVTQSTCVCQAEGLSPSAVAHLFCFLALQVLGFFFFFFLWWWLTALQQVLPSLCFVIFCFFFPCVLNRSNTLHHSSMLHCQSFYRLRLSDPHLTVHLLLKSLANSTLKRSLVN